MAHWAMSECYRCGQVLPIPRKEIVLFKMEDNCFCDICVLLVDDKSFNYISVTNLESLCHK